MVKINTDNITGPVNQWHGVIGEQTIADAILDRIVHDDQRLEIKGESMRKKRISLAEELTEYEKQAVINRKLNTFFNSVNKLNFWSSFLVRNEVVMLSGISTKGHQLTKYPLN